MIHVFRSAVISQQLERSELDQLANDFKRYAATVIGIPLLAGDQRELNKLATTVANLTSILPERDDAIALSPFELPLQPGTFEPVGMNTIHSCLCDAAPDARGCRVAGYKFCAQYC